MSSRIIYPLQRSGNLLFLRASGSGSNGDSLRVRLLVPVLQIAMFNCLGKAFPNFPIVALNLSFNPLMSGLLGMDFLSQAGVTIDIPKAEIILKL